MPKGKYAWTATVGPGDTLLLLGDEDRGIAIPNKGAFSDLFAVVFDDKDGDNNL